MKIFPGDEHIEEDDISESTFPSSYKWESAKLALDIAGKQVVKAEHEARYAMNAAAEALKSAKIAKEAIAIAKTTVNELAFKEFAYEFIQNFREKFEDNEEQRGAKRKRETGGN